MQKIVAQIAAEIRVTQAQVQSAVDLLDSGATVPFIARYRKEATNGLDDIQLRELDARLSYLRELADRRSAILKNIDEQGKLTAELRADIKAADSKARLEDLYFPYKPKHRTRAQIAREVVGLRGAAGLLVQVAEVELPAVFLLAAVLAHQAVQSALDPALLAEIGWVDGQHQGGVEYARIEPVRQDQLDAQWRAAGIGQLLPFVDP